MSDTKDLNTLARQIESLLGQEKNAVIKSRADLDIRIQQRNQLQVRLLMQRVRVMQRVKHEK